MADFVPNLTLTVAKPTSSNITSTSVEMSGSATLKYSNFFDREDPEPPSSGGSLTDKETTQIVYWHSNCGIAWYINGERVGTIASLGKDMSNSKNSVTLSEWSKTVNFTELSDTQSTRTISTSVHVVIYGCKETTSWKRTKTTDDEGHTTYGEWKQNGNSVYSTTYDSSKLKTSSSIDKDIIIYPHPPKFNWTAGYVPASNEIINILAIDWNDLRTKAFQYKRWDTQADVTADNNYTASSGLTLSANIYNKVATLLGTANVKSEDLIEAVQFTRMSDKINEGV